jgi:hypothetical protein
MIAEAQEMKEKLQSRQLSVRIGKRLADTIRSVACIIKVYTIVIDDARVISK